MKRKAFVGSFTESWILMQIGNYTHIKQWYGIMHPYSYFHGGLAKPVPICVNLQHIWSTCFFFGNNWLQNALNIHITFVVMTHLCIMTLTGEQSRKVITGLSDMRRWIIPIVGNADFTSVRPDAVTPNSSHFFRRNTFAFKCIPSYHLQNRHHLRPSARMISFNTCGHIRRDYAFTISSGNYQCETLKCIYITVLFYMMNLKFLIRFQLYVSSFNRRNTNWVWNRLCRVWLIIYIIMRKPSLKPSII